MDGTISGYLAPLLAAQHQTTSSVTIQMPRRMSVSEQKTDRRKEGELSGSAELQAPDSLQGQPGILQIPTQAASSSPPL